jgi:heme exporter protein A
MAASICIELAGLAVDGLSLQRGERMLFRDLGFAMSGGQALALVGPNGAGKTSLLRAIAGFLEPRAGTISLRTKAGQTITEVEERAQLIGWLGHHDGFKSQMTAFEAVAFFAQYYVRQESGASLECAVGEALSSVGLARIRDLPVQYLSAGQRRRLALARLNLSARPLWLLDEPLAALDMAGKGLAAEFIAAHCRQGGLVIAATHEPLGLDCTTLTLNGEGAVATPPSAESRA